MRPRQAPPYRSPAVTAARAVPAPSPLPSTLLAASRRNLDRKGEGSWSCSATAPRRATNCRSPRSALRPSATGRSSLRRPRRGGIATGASAASGSSNRAASDRALASWCAHRADRGILRRDYQRHQSGSASFAAPGLYHRRACRSHSASARNPPSSAWSTRPLRPIPVTEPSVCVVT